MEPEPTSPRIARTWVRELLANREVGIEVVQDAELLVTELVTNAVIHARTPVTLAVAFQPGVIEFTVSDESARTVELRLPSPEAVTGRGVYFLDLLASDWEVLPTADGKSVRFSLSVDTIGASR